MDLSIRYLGFELPHPFMPGASPLADDIDTVRRLEDAGAAAIVMRSLFEEQLNGELASTYAYVEQPSYSFAEALSYLPPGDEFALGPDEYLDQVLRIKEAVDLPVIASLNGTTRGGWLEFSRLLKEAGADALELNVYRIGTQAELSSAELEGQTLEMVAEVKRSTSLPLAVKLSPFYSALAHFAHELTAAGADALVVFNRFYQADIDTEELRVEKTLHLSNSTELLLRLRWLAILFGQVPADLAVTGGVHTCSDAIKAVMAGASAVQMVSALFNHGPEHLVTLRRELSEWLEAHHYDSLAQMCGSMSLERCPNPESYERANYIHILQTRRGLY